MLNHIDDQSLTELHSWMKLNCPEDVEVFPNPLSKLPISTVRLYVLEKGHTEVEVERAA